MNTRGILEQSIGFPLVMASVGQPVVLQSIRAERDMQTHLYAMGLYPGVELTVLSKSQHGPCILSLKEARLALDWGMACRILVG